jgi:hypothetical protein
VRQDDLQLREVDGHVVDRHRIGEDVARTRENRRPGVEHHRHAACLAFAVDLGQLPEIAAIAIRGEQLVRRMNLDQADAEIEDAADLGMDVHLVERIDRADRQQTVTMLAGERRDPVVHLAGEPHHVGRDVIDAAGALHPIGVEIAEEALRRLEDLLRVAMRLVVDHRERLRLHHLPGLYVDVDVEDRHGEEWLVVSG